MKAQRGQFTYPRPHSEETALLCLHQGNVTPEPLRLTDHTSAIALLLLVLLVSRGVGQPGLWWWSRCSGDRWEGAISGFSGPPDPLVTPHIALGFGCGAAPGILLSQSQAPWGHSVVTVWSHF